MPYEPVQNCPVTVIIPSMPERAELLVEALASIDAQTVAPADVLVNVSEPVGGFSPAHTARSLNILLAQVTTPWVTFAADDDVYLPHHFATIVPLLDEDVEVAYTYAEGGAACPYTDVGTWTQAELVATLERTNVIAGGAVFSVSALRAIGGWSEDFDPATRRFATGVEWEDWDLLLRLARAGARFRCDPVITWQHRHGWWPACTH